VTVPSDVSTLPAAQLLGAKQGHSQRYLYFWEQQDEPKFPCDQSPNEGKFRNLEAMLDKHEQVLANDDGSDILLAVRAGGEWGKITTGQIGAYLRWVTPPEMGIYEHRK
jgi:hypothetical protein